MAAAEALIVLSLLGCDDTGTQCEFLRAAETRYETVEACGEASDAFLAETHDENYPAVVAVCAPAAEMAEGAVPPELPENVEAPVAVDVKEPDFLERIAGAITGLAPDRETIAKPVEVAAEGAAKVGGAVIVGVKRVAGAVNPF